MKRTTQTKPLRSSVKNRKVERSKQLKQKTPVGPNHDLISYEPEDNQNYAATGLLPIFKNWYADGYVTKPKDQANCGACWAFTAASTLESLAFISGFDDRL